MTTLLSNMKSSFDKDISSIRKFKTLVSSLYRKYPECFYVNTPSKEDFDLPMAVTKYITRYIGRPVMAQSRITDYGGTNVTYWYQRHEDNEIIYKIERTHEFIKN